MNVLLAGPVAAQWLCVPRCAAALCMTGMKSPGNVLLELPGDALAMHWLHLRSLAYPSVCTGCLVPHYLMALQYFNAGKHQV